MPGLGTFHTFQFLSAVHYYVHNDCFLCLLFPNYNVWPPVMDFMVCLDGKVPQQFNLLNLFYPFGGMLIPFVTALNSIFLAHLLMNDPPNNIMPLFIFCLRKLGATAQIYYYYYYYYYYIITIIITAAHVNNNNNNNNYLIFVCSTKVR